MEDRDIIKIMNRLLNEMEGILYTEDQMNRAVKVDKLLNILEEEYDI